jgi:hypothetical protein
MQPIAFTPRLFFMIAAIVCFVVALLIAVNAFSGGNETAWEVGGLLALALGFTIP